MYSFVEKGLIRKIYYIAKRYTKAKNKHMKKKKDPTKMSKFITYLDINNLYGQQMSRSIPVSSFKWLKNDENFDLNSIN